MSDDSDKLWDCLCCCGDDHKVREGGSHILLGAVLSAAVRLIQASFPK